MSKGVSFYLMRHAETTFNRYDHVQGWCDSLLSPKGIEQAQASGRGIASLAFDAVYTSDLKRAQDTARHVLALNQSTPADQVQTMRELREINFGSFEGRRIQTLKDQVVDHLKASGQSVESFLNKPDIPQLLKIIKHLDPYHEAENYVEFWNRIESGLLILLNKHAGTDQKILIVSHGWTIHNLIHGLIAHHEPSQQVDYCSLSIVEYRDGQFHLNAFNQTDHFINDPGHP